MNQEKLDSLIHQIKKENKKGDLTLKYGNGDSVILRQGGAPMITDDGWLCVVNNENDKVHYINLETVYEIIMNLNLE
ncbi:hypothetical protein [Methanobrevibacter sp.]